MTISSSPNLLLAASRNDIELVQKMSGSARSEIFDLLWEHLDCTTTAPALLIAYACLYNNTEVFNEVIPMVHPQRVKQWIINWEEYGNWDLSMLNTYIDTQFFQQEQYATRAVLEINMPSTGSNQRTRKI